MRSRPNVELRLWPKVAAPGDTVKFELTVIGRSDTPVDAVFFRVAGTERRQMGKSALVYEHVNFKAEFDGFQLAEGQRQQLTGTFSLPRDIPPSFAAGSTVIEYVLEAHVDIPWWPDRVMTWELEVRAAPSVPKREPAFFSNAPSGPRGTELAMEVSLNDTELALGGTLDGAVAVFNPVHHRVTRIEARLAARDDPAQSGGWSGEECLAYEPVVVCDRPPQSGVRYPFRIPVPHDTVPSFQGMHSRLVWHVELRAVVRLGSDLALTEVLRFHAAPARALPAAAAEPRRAPPMGAERRALIWKQVAERHGLTATEHEAMIGTVGAVALSIALELRKDTLWSVASLDWPELRLELEVSERRLFDKFDSRIETGDALFDGRFTARARDAGQLRDVLGEGVRHALSAFERVSVDDEGAMLASAGNGYTAAELDRFVTAALEAARQLAARLDAVPTPPGLEACRATWAALAAKLGGTFSAGDLSIRGATFRDSAVELLTRFDAELRPVSTVARIMLPKAAPQPLPAEAQRVLGSISAECEGVRVESDAVEATLSGPLADPERAERLWRTLQRLSAAVAPTA